MNCKQINRSRRFEHIRYYFLLSNYTKYLFLKKSFIISYQRIQKTNKQKILERLYICENWTANPAECSNRSPSVSISSKGPKSDWLFHPRAPQIFRKNIQKKLSRFPFSNDYAQYIYSFQLLTVTELRILFFFGWRKVPMVYYR